VGLAVGWTVVAPLLAVSGARFVAWDSRSTLVGLNALTPLLFLLTEDELRHALADSGSALLVVVARHPGGRWSTTRWWRWTAGRC